MGCEFQGDHINYNLTIYMYIHTHICSAVPLWLVLEILHDLNIPTRIPEIPEYNILRDPTPFPWTLI